MAQLTVDIAAVATALNWIAILAVMWWQSGITAEFVARDFYQMKYRAAFGAVAHVVLVVFIFSDAVTGEFGEMSAASDGEVVVTTILALIAYAAIIGVLSFLRVGIHYSHWGEGEGFTSP